METSNRSSHFLRNTIYIRCLARIWKWCIMHPMKSKAAWMLIYGAIYLFIGVYSCSRTNCEGFKTPYYIDQYYNIIYGWISIFIGWMVYFAEKQNWLLTPALVLEIYLIMFNGCLFINCVSNEHYFLQIKRETFSVFGCHVINTYISLCKRFKFDVIVPLFGGWIYWQVVTARATYNLIINLLLEDNNKPEITDLQITRV